MTYTLFTLLCLFFACRAIKEATTAGSKVYRTNLELLLIAQAVGRGGEHYLLRWDEAHWDPRFRVPDFEWPLQKQTDEQCMVFIMMLFVSEAFLLDVFWAFGAYFIAESGALNMTCMSSRC